MKHLYEIYRHMYRTKTFIYSMLTSYFFCEIFWPLGQFPQWLVVTVFTLCMVLYLDNLLTWWRVTHET